MPQPDPDLKTGLQYLRAGWFDRAEPLFRSALGRHGERPDILHYLAVCLSQRGALAEAEALWRKAIAKDPNEPMLSYNLGLVARRLGRLDEAARRFRDTIRRAPNQSRRGWRWPPAIWTWGASPPPNANWPKSSSISTQAMKKPGGEQLRPLQARARNMLGYALYRLARFDDAIAVLDLAMADAGDDAARRGQILGDRALVAGRPRPLTTKPSPKPREPSSWRRKAPACITRWASC